MSYRVRKLTFKYTAAALFAVLCLFANICPALGEETQTVVITANNQVVDSFCGVDACYVLESSNTGPYCCAGYVKKFYTAIYNVNVYQINTYAGPPVVSSNDASVSLKQVDTPQPGDIMQNTARTHVAIVKSVENGVVTLIEQNWKWTSGGTVYAKINRKIGAGDAYFYRLVKNGKDVQRADRLCEKDTTPPVISDVSISNVTRNTYMVTCRVSDNIGIARVQFPSWSESSGQDDLPSNWTSNSEYSGTITGDTVTYVVKRSAHNGEYGIYNTHIYAYDTSGNVCGEVAPQTEMGLAKTSKSFTAYICNIRSGKYITIASNNYPAVKNLRSDTSQLFKFKKRSDGYYTITSVSTGKRLCRVQKSDGSAVGVKLVKASGNDGEYWKLYGCSDKCVLRNKMGNEIMMLNGDALKSGTKLRMSLQNATKTGYFRLVR